MSQTGVIARGRTAAQGVFFRQALPRFEAHWEGELLVGVSRREEVRIVGAAAGVADTDRIGVLTDAGRSWRRTAKHRTAVAVRSRPC